MMLREAGPSVTELAADFRVYVQDFAGHTRGAGRSQTLRGYRGGVICDSRGLAHCGGDQSARPAGAVSICRVQHPSAGAVGVLARPNLHEDGVRRPRPDACSRRPRAMAGRRLG